MTPAAALLAAEPPSAAPPEPVVLATTGEVAVPAVSLRVAVAAAGAAPLVVLSLINGLDYAVSAALAVLAPDIQRSLRLSDTALLTVVALSALFFVVAAVPVGFLADRLPRPRVIGALTLLASLGTLATGAVRGGVQLALARVATGAAQSGIQSAHLPLLADTYPPGARARVYGVHSLAPSAGRVLGPVVAGPLAAAAGGSAGWRWPFVLLAGLGAVLGAVALGLREPGRGLQGAESGAPVALGVAVARLLRIRTLFFVLASLAVLGAAVIAVPTLLSLYYERVHGLGPLARGLVVAVTEIGSAAGIIAGALVGERLLRTDPRRTLTALALAPVVYAVLLSAAVRLPGVALSTAGITVAGVFSQLGVVPLYATVTAVVPPRLRSLAFALVGLFVVAGGGFLGAAVGGALSDDHGVPFGITAIVLASAPAAAVLLAYGARFVTGDVAAVVADAAEERGESRRVAAGGDVPVLQVRGLDVSYGGVQVLFGVDLDLRAGEVLALLGTNGAGKSTVLRAVSGLTVPDRGVIRLAGRSVTYADAPTRVRAGIVQVPGGRAVFPALSVLDNLLAGAHTYGWDRARQRRELDRVLDLFPALADRLGQQSGLLSGGEQHMLAIAKALVLRPRVLLLDELSLGLAPVVVAELLGVVARLKEEGVPMVVVEQSLNVALALADRAVFLEKGRVRFSGPARELAERGDLVRAVFLGGEGG